MSEITIKAGNVKIEANRNDLISVDETSDGIAFSFKGGFHIHYINNYMLSSTKQHIKNTADQITNKKILFDLNNMKRPVSIDAR